MLSELIWKKVKNKQKYITTNEDLKGYGYGMVLNSEYYDVLDQDIFNKFANGEC